MVPQKRDSMAPGSLIGIVIMLTILTILVLSTFAYVIRRIWLSISRRRNGTPEQTDVANKDSQNNWARKGSNILWASYINDNDLHSQFNFSRASKCSRMFSIGSVSTVGPLDKNPEPEEKTAAVDPTGIRPRNPYEKETTPTKTLARRSTAPVVQHRSNGSVEDRVKKVSFVQHSTPTLQESLDEVFIGKEGSVA